MSIIQLIFTKEILVGLLGIIVLQDGRKIADVLWSIENPSFVVVHFCDVLFQSKMERNLNMKRAIELVYNTSCCDC